MDIRVDFSIGHIGLKSNDKRAETSMSTINAEVLFSPLEINSSHRDKKWRSNFKQETYNTSSHREHQETCQAHGPWRSHARSLERASVQISQ